jgi:ribosome-binding protein aMBF1 (putative translation factor)
MNLDVHSSYFGSFIDVYVYTSFGRESSMQMAAREAAPAAGSNLCFANARVYRVVKSAPRSEHSDQSMRRVLAESVRRYRLERGWSIKTLAVRSHLAPTCVEQIEQGRRRAVRLGTVEILARALQVDVVKLLSLPDDTAHRRAGGIKGSKVLSPKRRVPSRPAPRYRS